MTASRSWLVGRWQKIVEMTLVFRWKTLPCFARGRDPELAGWRNGSRDGSRHPGTKGAAGRAGRIPRRRTEECLGGWWRASQTRTQGGTRERGKSRNQERCEIPNSSLSVPDVPALSARTRPVVSLNGLGGGGLSEGPGSKSPPSLLFSDRERESTGGCWKGRCGRGNDWLRMEEKGRGRRGGEVDICPR